MSLLRHVAAGLRSLFQREQVDRDLDEELRVYQEMATEEKTKLGMSRKDALREVRLERGGVDAAKEVVRSGGWESFLDTCCQDIRFGLRMLRKSPGFTAVAVLTLALGIGANTAIFSLVDWLVLRPLPIESPDRVVFLVSSVKGGGLTSAFPYPEFQDIRAQTTNIFSDVAAAQVYQMDGVSWGTQSQPMWASYVTGNLFDVLGIKPAAGRLLFPGEGSARGADPVLVISHSYWKSHFNADPDIVGQKVTVNRRPMTVVGVAPEGFRGLTSILDTQGYIPLAMAADLKDAPADFLTDRHTPNSALIARLRQGISLQEAQSALEVVARRLAQQHPELANLVTLRALQIGPAGLAIDPGHPEVLTLVSALFLILAGSVLVLACVNIANLLLVRAGSRQREMAMRAALGATRSRLVRHLLTESLLLAMLGGIAGVVLGLGASRSISSIPLRTSLPIVLDFRFDWRVFAYAFGAALLTGLLVGIVPALRAGGGDVNEILHEGGRTSTSGRNRLRSALVAAQVGGSLMLLIVAGLFVRSLRHVEDSNLGFDPSGVLNLTVDPHEAGYDQLQTREFFRNLLERAQSLPGVQSASLAASVPMGYDNFGSALTIDGYEPPAGHRAWAHYNAVSPGYFETMRIPLLRGREFLDSDTENSPHVALISKEMAERYWHGKDPIGRNFSMVDQPTWRIVGIVGNIQPNSYEAAEALPFFYVPLAQFQQTAATLQVRTTAAPEMRARQVIGLVHSLEPAMPVFDVQPMTAALDTLNGFLMFQFAAALAASLGLLGLVLAVVGVYGVVSYAASERTHEIGLRIALGAQRRDVLRMIFGQGLVIVLIGVAAGLAAAAGMAKLVGNFLVGVGSLDPITYSAASLLLALIALAASYMPAHHAMCVDPMVALRHE
jgi:macrolide transport system ATP-binding/permease protein